MRTRPMLLPLLVLPAVLGLLLAGCGGSPTAASTPLPSSSSAVASGEVRLSDAARFFVEVQVAERGPVAALVRAPARVAFRDGGESHVGAPIEGRVTAVHVRAGARISHGDPLVELASPDAAAVRAELERLRIGTRAARDLAARQARMLTRGVGVESERLEATARLAEAESDLARAERTAQLLGEGAGATVTVRAPITGLVLRMPATVGSSVSPNGEPLVEIGDPSALLVVADVFERDLALVREGAAVTVDLDVLSQPVSGRVTSIGGALDATLRTAPVRIALDDPAVPLRAGMFARVTITADGPDGISLPSPAVLVKEGGRHVVWVETADGVFSPRDVRIGASIDGRVAVLEGLAPTDRVVVRGALLIGGVADQLL